MTNVTSLSRPTQAFSFDFSYGLPTVPKLDGLTPLVEIYGKGANRFLLLVTFQYPVDWVVVTPNNDANSEAGTISAVEYAKDDSGCHCQGH
jgi:hypothetical protein